MNTEEQKNKIIDTAKIREDCIRLSAPGDKTGARVCVVNHEMEQAFSFMRDIPYSVTFFGSARLPKDHPDYQRAKRIAYRIAKETKYVIVTGGGPGIMQAGNEGATEAGGKSLGFTIQLPHEQSTNPYVTQSLPFYFFFSRKVTMAYGAEAYIYFPGGFGTMDELFEILTLVQTHKIQKVPIILVGKKFWEPLHDFIQQTLFENFQTISKIDMDLYTITDDEDLIVDIVKNAPLRDDN